MARKPDKRTRLIAAATKLFYEQGYAHTSLAEIAASASVQLGNVYYYFKTKEEIGEAVVQYLSAMSRAMQELWETQEASPIARLVAFIQIHLDRTTVLARYGCPIGGLCTALRRSDSRVAASHAAAIYVDIQVWVQKQFELLGRRNEAEELTSHLLCMLHGAVAVASVLGDAPYLERELKQLQGWLRRL